MPSTATPASPDTDISLQALARRLAPQATPQMQRELVQEMEDLLAKYRLMEQRFELPHGDVPGAVAAFIAGNYMALRDVDFPDQGFTALVAQMRALLAGRPHLVSGTPEQRQQVYQEMVIGGMQMALARDQLRQQPNERASAQLRQAAKARLDEFLRMDTRQLRITEQGMAMQPG
ncbi:DUF6683 family protein [Ideonella sp. BN130291]|uniref:DUF6683 family protein n=1 Tax=Ideonella sp. BN130291 TaxID=3112940 RepID=UPI002E2698C8|nr:DUF6683 family protein [Ideonella sp. BN130291]